MHASGGSLSLTHVPIPMNSNSDSFFKLNISSYMLPLATENTINILRLSLLSHMNMSFLITYAILKR